jgi:hypothetical protein
MDYFGINREQESNKKMMARTAIMVKRFFKIYAKEKLFEVEWTDEEDDDETKRIKSSTLTRMNTRRWKKPKQ